MNTKKKVISAVIMFFFLSGCGNTKQQINGETTQPTRDERQPLPTLTETTETLITNKDQTTPTSTQINDGSIEVTGSYFYYLKTDNSIAPYKITALRRVCFEPAQLETVNNGNILCFTNTQQALDILQINNSDTSCSQYWGVGTFHIKNLTQKSLSYSKGDPCVEAGTCEFNEAELVREIKQDFTIPAKCAN